MTQNIRRYDVLIVGGGYNGLVAASYLAKAGKAVLLLDANAELGGATTSVKPFPDYEARLSRYSYLVSLLPDQIVSDLGINFTTLDDRSLLTLRITGTVGMMDYWSPQSGMKRPQAVSKG